MRVEAFHVCLGEDKPLKAEALSLDDALLDARHGAYLSAEAHLTRHGRGTFNGGVDIAGKHSGNNAKVDGRVADTQSTGHVEKDILGTYLEAHALFQYGQ